MAVTQYIGARYVPKFYEGSSGSEWDANVVYDPLTIVTWIGSSWTSKKKVPASVGAPNLNPAYWVNTGNYNEQFNEIIQLMYGINSDIADINNDIGGLDTRLDAAENNIVKASGVSPLYGDIVCVGDSYLMGANDHGAAQTNWGYYIGQMTGKTVHSFAMGGIGFGNTKETTFYSLLNSHLADITNKVAVTLVIVGGGYNDASSSQASITSGIANFSNLVKTQFPNASCLAVFMPWCVYPDNQQPNQRRLAQNYWRNGCASANVKLIDNANLILGVDDWQLMIDSKHPNSLGQNRLAACILNCIGGGSINVSKGQIQTGTAAAIGIENNNVFYNKYNSQWIDRDNPPETVTFNDSSVTLNGDRENVIATLTTDPLLFKPPTYATNYYAKIPVQIGIRVLVESPNTRKYYIVPGYILFNSDGSLTLHGFKVTDDNANWDVCYVDRFQILPGVYERSLQDF